MKRYINLNPRSLVSDFPKALDVVLRFLVEEHGYNKVRSFIRRMGAEHLFISINEGDWRIK